MLNFLSNVFQDKISPKNICSGEMITIQACLGCDGECLYSCDAVCANHCEGETETPPPPSCRDCNQNGCTGFLQNLLK